MRTIELWPAWARNVEHVFVFPPYAFCKPYHGPEHEKTWKHWWSLFEIRPVICQPQPVNGRSWNIWVYTRWGAQCWGVSFIKGWPRIPVDGESFTAFQKRQREVMWREGKMPMPAHVYKAIHEKPANPPQPLPNEKCWKGA